MRPTSNARVLRALVILSLFKKFFVDAFDVKRVFNAAANFVTDHQFRKLRSIDKHNPFAQKVRSLTSRVREVRCGNKQSLCGLEAI